ncbi:MAG: hypothetical protein ACRDO2_01050 [Nocardioidaceae bacterium]
MGDELWWTGRFPEAWPPGGHDGWNTPRRELATMLETCSCAVILDVPSFPWPLMQGRRLDTPLVLRLPEQLDAVVLSQLLGAGVLGRLTPYDRLIHGDPGVREQLSEQWELPDVWLTAAELLTAPTEDPRGWRAALLRRIDDSGPADRLSKARHNQVLTAAQEELQLWAASEPADGDVGAPHRLVALAAPTRFRPCALPELGDRTLRLERFEPDAEGSASTLAPPGAAVVLLVDEGQPADERGRVLARAARVLPAGGTLIVVGHVVTAHPDRPNPSMGDLVDDLQRATGCALGVQRLASLRWEQEMVVRGVVLSLTKLTEAGG